MREMIKSMAACLQPLPWDRPGLNPTEAQMPPCWRNWRPAKVSMTRVSDLGLPTNDVQNCGRQSLSRSTANVTTGTT